MLGRKTLLAICFSILWPAAHAEAELEKLRVAYSAIAAGSIVTWTPKEAGIYRKYGLDVDLVYVAGARALAALISGDVQVVQGSGGASILSRLAGSDATIVASTTNVIPIRLVTTPDISGAKDIKGKTFGVSRFGSLTDIGLRKAMSRLGVDSDKEIKLLQTGGEPENLLFMQRGLIKGALLSSINLRIARDLGYRELVNLAEINYLYPATVLITTDSLIRSRSRTLKLFLKAAIEGIRHSRNNPEFTVNTLAKYTRAGDFNALASSFQDYVLPYIREVPMPGAAEIESALTDLAATHSKARSADPKLFFDQNPLLAMLSESEAKR